MKKQMLGRNAIIIGALVLVIIVIAVIGLQAKPAQRDLSAALTPAVTAAPTATAEPQPEATAMAEPQPEATATDSATATDAAADPDVIAGVNWRAAAYLIVTTDAGSYYPLPLLAEGELPLEQEGGERNVVHYSPEGIYMASSNCDGQDCVQQGEVTMENRSSRILQNFILCLPNRVQLELMSFDEVVEAFELQGFTYEQIVMALFVAPILNREAEQAQ